MGDATGSGGVAMVAALLASGVLASALATRRGRAGEDGRWWTAVAVGCLGVTVAEVLLVLHGPAAVWTVPRVVALIAFAVAVPGLPLRRSRTDWPALVLDGVITVLALVLLLGLGVAALPGAELDTPSYAALAWAVLLAPFAVVAAGGLIRSAGADRAAGLVLLGVALSLTADLAQGLAPGRWYGPAGWVAVLLVVALLTRWLPAGEGFRALTDWSGPRHLGIFQSLLVAALVVVALRVVGNGREQTLIGLALAALLAQVLVEGRQNRRLLREVAEQADLTARQAETDRLTGLLNRPALLDRIERRLKGGGLVQVVILDLDGFTALNEARGHVTGDALLREVAARLRDASAPEDVVARFSADEFAVLVASDDLGTGHDLAHALIPAVAGPVAGTADDQEVSASVGLVRARNVTAATVVHHAELALGRAKAAGGSQVSIFQPWMAEAAAGRRRTRALLSAAITAGDLRLALQPVVDAADERWSSFEALVRWQDEDRLRMPMEFVPLAEESGLIVPLGTWVLEEALRQIATWPDAEAGIAVNVTARQLEQGDFAAQVTAALETSGVAPHRLILEIAEQTAVRDLGRTASRLKPLRDLGVHVALDDFGTGFSSLAYLAKLPVDILKIDQRFVAGLGTVPEDEALVRMMIRLGEELGLKVVAEGVETTEQAAALRGLGCDFFQGYLYSRPRPIMELQATWSLRRVPGARGETASQMARREAPRIDTAGPLRGM